MTHRWELVLGILSALLFFSLAAKRDGRPSLSLVTMVPLLELEKKLIDNLDDYAEALDRKLQLLRSHIQDMRAENEKAQVDPINYLSNPLNGLSIIRRLHRDWIGWRKFMEQPVGIVQMRKMNAWRKELPTDDDLAEACDGIVRIQKVHHLNVADMVRGQLKGRQYNSSMSPADIYAVGNFLVHNSTFPATFQWLREVLPLSQEDLVSLQDHIFSPEKEVIRLITAMHVNEGYLSIAMVLMNYWLELFPHDAYTEKAKLALENVMLHRHDAPFPGPYDLVTEPELKLLRWNCMNRLKRRSPGRLHCFYNSSTTPFLRLAPLKLEQIGLDPYVVLYHDVLSPREITQLQNLSSGRIKTAQVGGSLLPNRRIRSGKAFWVKQELNRLTKRIKRRIEDMSGLDLADSEPLQVVNYGIGGHFDHHCDFYDYPINSSLRNSENRIATVLFYLSDVEQGGETVFPRAGYSIQPRAGTALFWYNLHTDGVGDYFTVHAACPVLVGSKWVMTQWISEGNQLFRRPCLSRSPKPRKRDFGFT